MAHTRAFGKSLTPRPHVTLILAASLDGFIASAQTENTQQRQVYGLGSYADFQHLRRVVSSSDVVFVGAKSILNERGAFRVASLRERNDEPLWVVFSKSLDVDFEHAFWRQAGISRMVYQCEDFSAEIPSQIILENVPELQGTRVAKGSLASLMQNLHIQGIQTVSLLGGSQLATLFFNAGVIDEVVITLCPVLMGAAQGPSKPVGIANILTDKVELTLISAEQNSSEMYLRYKVEN